MMQSPATTVQRPHMVQFLALAYAAFIIGNIGFQIALIAGAPWGVLTQGGQHEGALPTSGRVAAGVSILILIGMGLAMVSQAGLWPHWPRWTGWAAMAVQALSTAANWATRSKPERNLWAPIISLMLVITLAIMMLGQA